MTEDAADLLAELRKLIADLKQTSDDTWFPCHTELKRLSTIAREMGPEFSQRLAGRRIAENRLYKWITKSWRGVKLRAVKFQFAWYTCDRWMADFIRDCSRLDHKKTAGRRTPKGTWGFPKKGQP